LQVESGLGIGYFASIVLRDLPVIFSSILLICLFKANARWRWHA